MSGRDARAMGSYLNPYLNPYRSCFMCLMRLLVVLRERG